MKLKDLNRSYGALTVLSDFSIDLPERGVLALLGPSGCGKTTLLFALCEALWKRGQKTAFVFQEDRLLFQLTALENVCAAGAEEERAKAILCELGLSDALTKYPAALSGGMKRRVALARALAYGGDVLFLDEPFKGLDEATRLQAAEAVGKYAPPLSVLVTHDKDEAKLLGARLLYLAGPPLRVEKEEQL